MTVYPYLGVCSNPDGEGLHFEMAKRDESCAIGGCNCTPVVYVLAAEAERALWAAGETIASLHRERDRAIETRENANACTLRVEAERDRYRQGLIDIARYEGWQSEAPAAKAMGDIARAALGEHPLSRTSSRSRTLKP